MRYNKEIFEQDCEQAFYSALRDFKKKVDNDEFIGYAMIKDHMLHSYLFEADYLSGYSRGKKEADMILWKWNERLNSELDDYKERQEEKKKREERERKARREREERESVHTKTSVSVSVSTSSSAKKIDWNGLIDKNGCATIPQGVRKIDDRAFFGNQELKSIHISDSVTEIGEMAFCMSGLENVVIPNSVTRIGKNAFAICQNWKSVDIPDSVIEVGEGAFNCVGLLKVRTNKPELLKNAVGEDIKICPLNGDGSDVEIDWDELIDDDDHAIIPEGVTEIDMEAFMQSSLASVEIPKSVVKICKRAFALSDLKCVYIPNSVTKIGDDVFAYCENLKEVVIPDSVQVFGSGVFEECDALEVVYTNKPEMVKRQVGENVKILPLKDYENKPSTVEEKTIVCPNCGTNNGSTAKFCLECGTPLQVVCPKCNSVQKAGFKFCMNCGNKF